MQYALFWIACYSKLVQHAECFYLQHGSRDTIGEDGFFDLLSRFQGNRMDDQRCSLLDSQSHHTASSSPSSTPPVAERKCECAPVCFTVFTPYTVQGMVQFSGLHVKVKTHLHVFFFFNNNKKITRQIQTIWWDGESVSRGWYYPRHGVNAACPHLSVRNILNVA